MSYGVSQYDADDAPDTVRPPPERGKPCYYCRHQATVWSGSHVQGAGDVPICGECDARAKRRRK